VSDTETRSTCLKVVSQSIDPALKTASDAINNSQPSQQQSILQWLSQNWWVVALALLAFLMLSRR